MNWLNIAIYGAIAIIALSIVWKFAKKLFKIALTIVVLAAIYAVYTGKI